MNDFLSSWNRHLTAITKAGQLNKGIPFPHWKRRAPAFLQISALRFRRVTHVCEQRGCIFT